MEGKVTDNGDVNDFASDLTVSTELELELKFSLVGEKYISFGGKPEPQCPSFITDWGKS